VRKFRSKASFSLIELAAIVGIIAVLLSVLFPAVNAMIERSQRAKAARNLRTIALAHANFIHDFGRAITCTDICTLKGVATPTNCDVNLFAAVLAKYGYIKDVSVWAWDFDYLVKKYKQAKGFLPTRMCNDSNDRIAPQFAGKQSGGDFPLSVVCCVVQCPDYDYSQVLNSKFPVACSRGLYQDGKWRKKSGDLGGLWGEKGGLVAFFDGHVEWYDNTIDVFYKHGTRTKTAKICDPLPNHGSYTGSCYLNWVGNGSIGGIHN
jgi:type II secretory pathway pseudopilin PulG